jgi:hypothetical protein
MRHLVRSRSEPQDRVTELIEQQTAISEVLRAIPSCRHQLSCIAPRWSAGPRMRQVMAHRDPTILRYGIAVLSVAIGIGLLGGPPLRSFPSAR